jgi:hypothetical protein
MVLYLTILLPPRPAYAADQVVTNLNDSGAGSLRQAIAAVHAGGNITFDPSLSGGTIILVTGELRIGKNLTITGPGADQLTISGNHASRVFLVVGGTTAEISGLTISAGKVYGLNGGGIYNDGWLTLKDSTISGNSTIFNVNGGYGGGILNTNWLEVQNSTISGNSASYSGGGIYNYSGAPWLIITRSTFSNNTATFGGGIANAGWMQVSNSTISGNSAIYAGHGGGISNSGEMEISSSTFSDNLANGGDGGALYTTGKFYLWNNILANSVLPGNDCHNNGGTLSADVNNLIESHYLCGTPVSSADPQLAPLADNGSPTHTRALQFGSPAIDAGNNLACRAVDQRGFSRPFDGDGDGTATCDMGAYEYGSIVVTNPNDSGPGSLRDAISSVGPGGTITFDLNAYPAIITLTSGQLVISTDLIITGPGTGQVTVSGGNTSRGFHVSNGVTAEISGLTISGGNAAASAGGGIYNYGTLTVSTSTFSGNMATYGGGIANDGTLTVENSTFSGNSANNSGYGGGIYNGATLTMNNSTFSGNSVNAGTGNGGSLYNNGTLYLRNTILANSTANNDCYNNGGTIAADVNNLIESHTGCGNPVSAADPNLGPLAANGGHIETHALLADSPAIDAGANATCLSVDQRGIGRPSDGKGDGSTTCDIGAYERHAVVTNTSDNGPGSLRQAIAAVHWGGPITFNLSAYPATITLASGQLVIDKDLTITGPANQVTVSGNDSSRVIMVNSSATAEISGLTISAGNVTSGSRNGGGIYIESDSALTVDSSTFSGNMAYDGGGIYNLGTLTVDGSTFWDNRATDHGGGIANDGTLMVNNSTFSINRAKVGGGIFSSDGTLTVDNSTLYNNEVHYGTGSGIYNTSLSALYLRNTILASSSYNDCYNDNILGASVNNLIMDHTDCGSPVSSADPNLGPLADNGGPTQTHALRPGSPAIDAGINGICLNSDQRGIRRLIDGDGDGTTACDIGAFEYGFSSKVVTNTNDSGPGSLRQVIADMDGDGTITFDLGSYPATITLTSGQLEINKDLTIIGPGDRQVTVSGNNASRVFHLSNRSTVEINSLTISAGNAGSSNGGGIYIEQESTLFVNNSTFFGNLGYNGGGIYTYGTVTVKNSTFSSNSTNTFGGGIYNYYGMVSVSSSTFSGNGSDGGNGGGIYNNGGILYLRNTILANSIAGNDCHNNGGTLFADVNNLIESHTGCGTPVSVADPNLGPLADNGGPTLTFALLPGSPAIDTGDNGTCLSADQRGYSRPFDGDGDGTATCDMGAFEYGFGSKVVTNPNDSGPGSLRDAISNVGPGGTITFDLNAYPAIITLTSGQLVISTDLIITGPGADQLKVSGDTASRVFLVNSGATAQISGLMISAGNIGSGNGGGIYIEADSALALVNSTLSANLAYAGGGIYNLGTLTVDGSTLSANLAGDDGGGIFIHENSTLTVTNSTLSDNSANSIDGGGGGGIYTYGTVTVKNSTFSGNSTNTFGGGILNNNGLLTVENSTFSGNAAVAGAAIFNYDVLILRNSILANSSTGEDCSTVGFPTFDAPNLIENNGDCGVAIGTDPNLGPLTANGGPTPTFALLPGSPAIDTGDNGTCLSADQRGAHRPQNGSCDIGAYERVTDAVAPTGSYGDGPGSVGRTAGDSALALWLAGDTGPTLTGSGVAAWADRSGYNRDAIQGTAAFRPTITTANLNNHDTLQFDGVNDRFDVDLDISPSQTPEMTIFIVYDSDTALTTPRRKLYGHDDGGYDRTIGLDERVTPMNMVFCGGDFNGGLVGRYTYLTANHFYISSHIWHDNPAQFSGWINGISGIFLNLRVYNGDGFPTLNIGSVNPATEFWAGDIAEFVIYSTELNSVQRILVENYLSAKYAIGISTNVYEGDTPSNGDFDRDVAGIGQFDGSQHTQAHSAGLILVDNNFLQADGDWLLFGHRSTTNDHVTDNLPTTGDWTSGNGERWARIFYLDVTDAGADCNTPGTCFVDLIFNYSAGRMNGGPLPAQPMSNYRLLKRSGTSGPFREIATATAIVGDQVQFHRVDVSLLGSNFTLGTVDSDTSPTAVTLQSFLVQEKSAVLPLGAAVFLLVLSRLAGCQCFRRRKLRNEKKM